MSNPNIQYTKDYTIFKTVKFNRDKQRLHIERLKKIIQNENLLAFHPIIVNEKMEIIDGQHRFEAAKELKLEVPYIKGEISYNHILESNLVQKKACLQDVVKFYAYKDKNENYLELIELIKSLKSSPKAILGLLFGTVSKSLLEMIKSGRFLLPSNQELMDLLVEHYSNFKEFAVHRKISPITMFNSADFAVALRSLVLTPGFDSKIWANKLELRWFELRPQASAQEWIRVLVGIYNHRNHNPLTIEADDEKE